MRGVALRALRDVVLHHHSTPAAKASSILQINFYVHPSIVAAGADRIGCSGFSQLLESVVRGAVVDCVDVDDMGSFSAAARAVQSAHMHVVPADLPSVLMLLLARDAAVVFVLHAEGCSAELAAERLQVLGDLPWLHVTHAWESDRVLRGKVHEAVEHAAIRSRLSIDAYG